MIGGLGCRGLVGGWVGGIKLGEKEHNVWSMVQTSLQKHQPNKTSYNWSNRFGFLAKHKSRVCFVKGKMTVGVRGKKKKEEMRNCPELELKRDIRWRRNGDFVVSLKEDKSKTNRNQVKDGKDLEM